MEGDEALTFARGCVAGLESYRLNNHIAANLHYLAMGRIAHEVGVVHAAMAKARRADDPAWFDGTGADRYFERRGHELRLRDELFYDCAPHIVEDDLKVSFQDRVRRRTLPVPVDAARLAWFRDVLPFLRPTVPIAEVRAACDADEWSFIEQLVDAGFLARVPRAARAPRSAAYGVRLLGHAALAVETPSSRILFDPLLVVRTRPIDLLHELDAGVDAVVVSHPHWDHFNFDTLLHIPRGTRMVVPRRRRRASIENVEMGALVRELGFRDVVELDPWESVVIGDVTVTAMPFYGEQSGPEADQDWMTFHVATGGQAFVGAVDSCHNAHATMDAVLREARERLGPISVLFSPFSEFHYPITMFTRRPFYLGPGSEQYSGGADDAARWCSLLGAEVLVPYAGFVWTNDDYARPEDRTHRGSLRRVRSVMKSYPEGPLVVLEPGGAGITWNGAGGPLAIPSGFRGEAPERLEPDLGAAEAPR